MNGMNVKANRHDLYYKKRSCMNLNELRNIKNDLSQYEHFVDEIRS
jgi:hypothetical protein